MRWPEGVNSAFSQFSRVSTKACASCAEAMLRPVDAPPLHQGHVPGLEGVVLALDHVAGGARHEQKQLVEVVGVVAHLVQRHLIPQMEQPEIPVQIAPILVFRHETAPFLSKLYHKTIR